MSPTIKHKASRPRWGVPNAGTTLATPQPISSGPTTTKAGLEMQSQQGHVFQPVFTHSGFNPNGVSSTMTNSFAPPTPVCLPAMSSASMPIKSSMQSSMPSPLSPANVHGSAQIHSVSTSQSFDQTQYPFKDVCDAFDVVYNQLSFLDDPSVSSASCNARVCSMTPEEAKALESSVPYRQRKEFQMLNFHLRNLIITGQNTMLQGRATRNEPMNAQSAKILQYSTECLKRIQAEVDELEVQLRHLAALGDSFSMPIFGTVDLPPMHKMGNMIPVFDPDNKSHSIEQTWGLLCQVGQQYGLSESAFRLVLHAKLQGEAAEISLMKDYLKLSLKDFVRFLHERFGVEHDLSDLLIQLASLTKDPHTSLIKYIAHLKVLILKVLEAVPSSDAKLGLRARLFRQKLQPPVVSTEVWKNVLLEEVDLRTKGTPLSIDLFLEMLVAEDNLHKDLAKDDIARKLYFAQSTALTPLKEAEINAISHNGYQYHQGNQLHNFGQNSVSSFDQGHSTMEQNSPQTFHSQAMNFHEQTFQQQFPTYNCNENQDFQVWVLDEDPEI